MSDLTKMGPNMTYITYGAYNFRNHTVQLNTTFTFVVNLAPLGTKWHPCLYRICIKQSWVIGAVIYWRQLIRGKGGSPINRQAVKIVKKLELPKMISELGEKEVKKKGWILVDVNKQWNFTHK